MSSKPKIVEISSDSSDSSADTTPFPTYVPPFRPPRNGCRTKEQARKRKHDINVFKDLFSPSEKQSTSKEKGVMTHSMSNEEETNDLAKKLPNTLVEALGQALSSLKKIPVPEPSFPSCLPPLRVVLGLACKNLWDKNMQARGVHKQIPNPKDKGKQPME